MVRALMAVEFRAAAPSEVALAAAAAAAAARAAHLRPAGDEAAEEDRVGAGDVEQRHRAEHRVLAARAHLVVPLLHELACLALAYLSLDERAPLHMLRIFQLERPLELQMHRSASRC